MRRAYAPSIAVLPFLLFASLPAFAGSLQVWEGSPGTPGVTSSFENGDGLLANLHFDADSAEGGSLPAGGPSEILIRPTGDILFVAFTCQLSGCTGGPGGDYTFTQGGEGLGELKVSDPNSTLPETGVFDIGVLEFDIASGVGTIELIGCNYFSDFQERTCDPFTLVTVPEPGTASLLAIGLSGVAIARRRRL